MVRVVADSEVLAPTVRVLAQAKAPVLLVIVQPVEPEPPPSRMSPVDVPPIETVLEPFESIVRPPLPVEIALAETFRLLTAVPVRVPPLTVPPEIVAPFSVELHANAPVELVTVQPVEPEPPPSKMSPVLVPPMLTVLLPFASTVRPADPAEMAFALTFREFTAVPVSVPPLTVPPETVPPLKVPPDIVAPLIVLAAVTAPAALTLNLLVGDEPLCRSIRLPDGEALVLLAKITA